MQAALIKCKLAKYSNYVAYMYIISIDCYHAETLMAIH